jgi:hypothetical protein
VQALENTEQVGERSAKPVNRPRCDHIELLGVHRLHHSVQSRTLISALGSADASVFVNIGNLPAGPFGDRLKLSTLIVSRLLVRRNSEIDGNSQTSWTWNEQRYQ